MKYQCSIANIKSSHKVEGFWGDKRITDLLELFEAGDCSGMSEGEKKEMLQMGITDNKPEEAAEIVLNYIFKDRLNERQTHQMAHDMLEEDLSQEYPEIAYHHELFQINQLLFEAYNGKFPNSTVSIVSIEIDELKELKPYSNSRILNILSGALSENSVLCRLYEDQLKENVEFKDANSIVWKNENTAPGKYTIVTSSYWLDRDDFELSEYEVVI